jgi:CheY-like chemotaxis protein
MRLSELTVLLVEDDVDNLELIGSFLEDEGARVLSAGSIAAALALSLEHPFDVVVSDLELPDGDGCALLKQLKLREARTHVPAIAVSGYSQSEWGPKASECGFRHFLMKPFSLDELLEAVSELAGPSGHESPSPVAAG